MRILGISCFYHDAAAVLIEDGTIIAAAEEERFSRIKHDSGFPKLAVEFCLKQAGIKSSNLDYIVFYEKPFLKFERIILSFLDSAPLAREAFVDAFKTWLKEKIWIKALILSQLKVDSKKIKFCGHHMSHAASSFYTSPFKRAAILTCDGVGEWTTTAWGKGEGSKLYIDEEIRFPHSLGLFYSTFTQFLGFEINEGEYKVMGLAPYGKPKYKSKVEKLIEQNHTGAFKLDLSYFNFLFSDKLSYSKKFVDLFGKPVKQGESDMVKEKYADIAASAQKVLEEKLLSLAKAIKEKSNEDNLCYAGGVALNGVANWRIFKEAGFKNIFIHPAAGDSGGAIGAALYFYHHVLNNPRKNTFRSVYLGASNSQGSVAKFISANKIPAKLFNDTLLIDKVAGLLAKGKVIGWVRGNFEWGPRALGARSILADPRSKIMKDIVNSKIKFREGFRPFAPVTLIEMAKDYFEIDGMIPPILEYMLAVVPVRRKWRGKLGAITHIDGTARPQLLRRQVNPVYYDLIKKFGEKTGVSVLLNTSFNLKGQPIVNTCEEAYKTFLNSGLDALVLENYLIEKELT